MTSTELAVPAPGEDPHFAAALAAEEEAERDLWRSLARTILIALPVSIAFFLLLTGLAIGDKAAWYVWVGLGVGIGTIGALLLGSLAGATLNAHRLDELDRAEAA